MKNKVTKEDLKGEIKDFPLEIIQAMCNEQVRQGNTFNPKVFQKDKCAEKYENGFSWYISELGRSTWETIILECNFESFPKSKKTENEIKITEDAIKKAFEDGSEIEKNLLKNLFKDQVNFKTDPSKFITSYEEALKYLEYERAYMGAMSEKHLNVVASMYKLIIIAEAWNKADNFVPDYDNTNQYKWFPWFQKRDTEGFVFASTTYEISNAYAYFGSQLCFSTSKRAEQFGKMFIDLWNDFLN